MTYSSAWEIRGLNNPDTVQGRDCWEEWGRLVVCLFVCLLNTGVSSTNVWSSQAPLKKEKKIIDSV